MKNIKNFDNFIIKEKHSNTISSTASNITSNTILNYDEFMQEGIMDWGKKALGKVLSPFAKGYKKATTTGKGYDTEASSQKRNLTIEPEKTNRDGGEFYKDVEVLDKSKGFLGKAYDEIGAKGKRVFTGTNMFIDTKKGTIGALDQLLSDAQLQEVVDIWKKNKDDAASYIMNIARIERDQEFSIAAGIMMSATISGIKSLVVPKMPVEDIIKGSSELGDRAAAAMTNNGADEYLTMTGSEPENVASVGKKIIKGVKNTLGGPDLPTESTFTDEVPLPIDKMVPKDILNNVADQGVDLVHDQLNDLTPKAMRKMTDLLKLVGADPADITQDNVDKAEKILNYLKDNNFIKGNLDDIEGLQKMKNVLQQAKISDVADVVPSTSNNVA